MAGISVDSSTSSSVTLYVSSLDTSWTNGTRDVEWYLGSAGGGIPTDSAYYKKKPATLNDGVSSGGEVTFTGLEASTTYGVYCMIWYGATLLAELQGYVTTDTAEIDVWSLTEIDLGEISPDTLNTIKFTANGYQVYRYSFTFPYNGNFDLVGFDTVDSVVCLTTNPEFNEYGGDPYFYDDDCWDDGANSNLCINTDIEKNTTYYLFCRGYNETVSGYCEIDFSIAAYAPSIAKWSWSASNGNASASETSAAYSAVVNETATTNFSHLVWNDMVDKVYEIIVESTNWWDSEYASYYNTKMNSEPYELTAVMFNSLRNNIELVGLSSFVNLGYKTGISKVFANDNVYGDYFLTLANYINSCIDNL